MANVSMKSCPLANDLVSKIYETRRSMAVEIPASLFRLRPGGIVVDVKPGPVESGILQYLGVTNASSWKTFYMPRVVLNRLTSSNLQISQCCFLACIA